MVVLLKLTWLKILIKTFKVAIVQLVICISHLCLCKLVLVIYIQMQIVWTSVIIPLESFGKILKV